MAMPSDPASYRDFSCSNDSDTVLPPAQNTFSIASGISQREPQREIVFIDASLYPEALQVSQAQSTQAQSTAGQEPSFSREFVLLELDRNGMYQISDALVDRVGITDLHLVVPGVLAQLRLGNAMLNPDTIDFYQHEFPIWDQALAADAEIWIHCDTVAPGNPSGAAAMRLGEVLRQRLSQLTQRRVYWSDRRF